MKSNIQLTNSLGKQKQEFKPLKTGKVGIYSCGPTVYNYAHIGNLRAYVFADTLKRMFLANGYKVNHVINITDVGHLSDDADSGEDKMLKGAKREGKTVWEIARFYEEEFKKDMNALNIIPPNHYPRATEHIQEMIEINKKLEVKGFTYISEGNLYFDTSKFKDYWKLIGREQETDEQQSRVQRDEHKKHPFDFVLWFTRHKYENHAMEWESPWGKGFPGWHIECSAMSSKYLGEQFDIHTGGIDHIPVHHTNEIAQSEAAFGKKWVNYWVHNEFLVVKDSEKMAKSSGNFLRLQTLLDKGYTALEYRYLLLGTHYRKKLMFSFEALDSAKNALIKLKNRVINIKKEQKEKKQEIQKDKHELFFKKLIEDINDDLNTPKVLASLWEFIQDESINPETKLKLIEEYDDVLGLKLIESGEEEIPEEIISLKNQRDEARKNKNWKLSDELRDKIISKGYQVFDTKEGTEVRHQ